MKNIHIGLKVWSTNRCYLSSIKKLKEEGYFSYIELFVEPGSLPEHLAMWKELDVPFILHAPHFSQGLNFGIREKEEQNRFLIKIVDQFEIGLNTRNIIFHPGTNGSLDETIRQINLFKNEFSGLFNKSIIENKPKVGLGDEDCIGASADEIRTIKEQTGLSFCFDVSHALCYAAWAKKQWAEVIGEFLELQPEVFHVCDGDINGVYDRHYHFGAGDYDLRKIFAMIPNNSFVSIETAKNSKENLDDFKIDVDYLRKCLN